MAFNFGSILGGLAKPLGGIVSSLAPMAGTVLGGLVGGPAGAGIGGGLGSAVGKLLGGLTGGGAQGQPSGAPQPSFGSQMANTMTSMIPQQFQNMSFGQMGNQLQNMGANAINQFMGPQAQQSGLGQSIMGGLSNVMGRGADYLQNRYGNQSPFQMPSFSQLGGMTPAGMAQQMGGGADSLINRGMGMLQNRMPQFGAQPQMMPQMEPEGYAFGGPVMPPMFPQGRGLGRHLDAFRRTAYSVPMIPRAGMEMI